MLELYIEDATKNGCHAHRGKHLYDERYHKDWTPGVYSFVLDQKVRHMILLKDDFEQLRVFPKFTIDGVDVTSEYLSGVVEYLEKCLGKMKYTKTRDKMRESVIKYFKEKGVEI